MMDTKLKDWIRGIAPAVVAVEKTAKQQEKKDALLSKLGIDRENRRGTIITGTDQKVSDGKKKQNTLAYGSRDQTEEFDLDEQRDGFRLAGKDGKIEEWNEETGTQEQFQKQLKAQQTVDLMVLDLEQQFTDEPEMEKDGKTPAKNKDGTPKMKRLFTDEEIAAEVYDPMLRRGLIPETMVPDKFSRTKELRDNSFDEYAKRLKEEPKKSFFAENKDLMKTMFSSSMTLVSSGMTLDSATKTKPEDLVTSWDPRKNITGIRENLGMQAKTDGSFATSKDKGGAIFGFISQGIGFTTDVAVEGGKDIREALKKDAPERAVQAPKLAGLIIAGAASALGAALKNTTVCIAASSAYGAAVKPGAIAKSLAVENFAEKDATAIVDVLKTGFDVALKKLDPKATVTKVSSTETIGKAITAIQNALGSGVKVADVATALNDGKLDKALGMFASAAENAATAGITGAVIAVFEGANGEKAQSQVSAMLTEEFNQPPEGITQEMITKHEQLVKGKDDAHAPDWEKKGGTYVCAVCEAGGKDARAFAGMIERKIAKLQRDQAILKWGSTLGALAFDVASNIIAPLAIGGAAVRMMQNLYQAVARTRDLLAFCRKQAGMFRAASAYSAPVDQFIHNSFQQSLHYEITAAAEALKMIAAIIQCTPAAAVGVGMKAGADIAGAVEAVLYEAKKRYDLEKAWTTYKLALSRPENRKLGLIAMKRNPTLAKYAIAWGAVEKKDPLVGDFMGACGLNAETLEKADAKISQVVSYLEARLPDDNVVVGRDVTTTNKWAPATVDLTVESWASVKGRGEEKGGVAPAATRPIESALAKLQPKYSALKTKIEKKEAVTKVEVDECINLLGAVDSALNAYSPKKAKAGGPHVEMEQQKDRFFALSAQRIEEVRGWAKGAV